MFFHHLLFDLCRNLLPDPHQTRVRAMCQMSLTSSAHDFCSFGPDPGEALLQPQLRDGHRGVQRALWGDSGQQLDFVPWLGEKSGEMEKLKGISQTKLFCFAKTRIKAYNLFDFLWNVSIQIHHISATKMPLLLSA